MKPRIVLVDNYDSFTFNLVQYLGELGADVRVFRNDQIDVAGIRALRPRALVVSPGPCTPDEAGVTLDAIRSLAGELPILGVCLGHQAIGQAFGGKVVRNDRIVHGKASPVLHRGEGLYEGLPSPFDAGRYHSLVVERASLPRDAAHHLLDRGGGDHGAAPPAARGRGRPVPPRVDPDRPGQAAARQLALAGEGMEASMILPAIARLVSGGDLTRAEMVEVMGEVADGGATPAQVGAFLAALRLKGETVEEIAGAAEVMRARADRVRVDRDVFVDTCGTGGDGQNTFNISTTAAFVVAGAGVTVAKHGNRSVSSKCGSADVLAALGVDVDAPKDRVERCIAEVGIGFLFAPRLHPAFKAVAGIRRELAIRTVFNLLGPLANPAGARHQLMGVYEPRWVPIIGGVLAALGTIHAFVVHGDGQDEIAVTGTTAGGRGRGGRGANVHA